MDPRLPPPVRPPLKREPVVWEFLDQCATAMAIVDGDLIVRMANQALCDWLGSATRSWRGEAIAMLDAKPPQLADAATRASNGQRRIWLRDARLRTAIGDRAADLAFTPFDDDLLLLEVHAPGAETAGAADGAALSASGFGGSSHAATKPTR